jgi:predicted Zn-dependent peptidase
VTRDDLFDYYRKHYIPSNMAVSIAGNFSRTKVKQILKNSFGKFDKKTPLDMPNLEIQDFNSANIIVRDNVSANFGALAFLGPDSSSDDIIKGSLAANVLYMYITRALKVKSDILNSIDVSFDTYLGPGAFYISYSYNPSYAKEVDEEIIRQLDNMLRGDILPIDIDRAKTHIKTALSFRRETQNAIASNAALWLLLGRKEFVNSDTYFQKIDALDVSDIKEFFNKYYSQDKTVKIAIQPRSSK